MALNFPSTPSPGDTVTEGTRTWTWDGSIWSLQAVTLGLATISTTELQNDAVTTAKIASGAVTAAKIHNAVTLDDIPDVTITSASSGQLLQWNGSAWVNATFSSDVMTDTRNAALILMDIGA